MQKKTLFIGLGLGDKFFSPDSVRKLPHSDKLLANIKGFLEREMRPGDGLLNVSLPKESGDHVAIYDEKNPRLILHGDSLLDKNNELSLYSYEDKERKYLNGDQFDHVFRPEEYEIVIMGIDINNIFLTMFDDLNKLGYHIGLTNLVKAFHNRNYAASKGKCKNIMVS
jgi:hypothetical protein